MMSLHTKRLRAFTLVELLVVIGIIAALIGILLPVLSGVQARGRDIKCQSNIRQILQAINGYAAENKGSLPYGFYFDPSMNDVHPDAFNPLNTWDPKNGTNRFVSWASQVGKYMVRKADGDNEDNNFPPVLNCPEAEMSFHHIVGYVANFVAFPSPWYDRQVNGSSRWISPPKTSGLFGHNILIWDTSVSAGLDNNVGYLTGADLDNQRFWNGATSPQFRFYDPADVYGRIPPGTLGNNKPVQMGANWKNIDPQDPSGNGPGFPYQGNMRFRHAKETAVNCGFMDGHVEPIKGKFKGDRTLQAGNSHDALRKYFMIKWPAGIARNTSVP
jgi:prepilin-type processing-associated H-X9-DG protein